MCSSRILIYFFVLYFHATTHAQECTDCIQMLSCDRVLPILVNIEKNDDSSSIELLRNALCGFDAAFHPKVCCSVLPEIKDPIDMHPNFDLLPKQCGNINGKRIIGGRPAELYEFPWMALISRNTSGSLQFQCGGTIINSRYVLTAAHCVQNPESIAGVRIGELDISTEIDCQQEYSICESNIQDKRVESVTAHRGFKGTTISQHDIALIRLETPIDLSQKNANPICLPFSKNLRSVKLTGMTATVAGWGITEQRQISEKLLKVSIPIKMKDDCLKFNDSTRKIICAGELNRDACSGDSGGPLMVESEYNGEFRYFQYGIVSYGINGCGSNKAGVYTDVSKFIEWILDNIRE